MAEIYILYSLKLNRYFIGSCLDFNERFKQHINKEFENSFTGKADDWELFFKKEGLREMQARAIEKHIKTMKSVNYILNLKLYPEMMDKLVKKYSFD
jgi:putative endonuclease